jgi:hypothetical protein
MRRVLARHRAEWPTIAAAYGIDIWFCDPLSPWQRGQVENLNRQWRFWFPRGMNLLTSDRPTSITSLRSSTASAAADWDTRDPPRSMPQRQACVDRWNRPSYTFHVNTFW